MAPAALGSVAADPLERAVGIRRAQRRSLFALIAAHAASRGLLGAFMHLLPPARSDGLSAGAGTVSPETAVVGAVLGAVALLALGLGGAFVALILLGLLFFAFRALCLNQIGGQTGDTIGALQQLGEIAVLLVASVFPIP